MQLTILGCSAAYPGAGVACSGYLIEDGDTKILIDCGTGVLSNLQRVAPISQVKHIIISHMHADHFFDLIPYRYALTRPLCKDIHPTVCLPPGGSKALLESVSAFNDSPTFFSEHFRIEEYNTKTGIKIGHLDIEFASVKHYIPSHAISLSGDRRLVYSADSGPCEELTRIARDADLFLCEATRCDKDNPEWGHLTAIEAAELAQGANVKRLVLTHFWPDCDYSPDIKKAHHIFGRGLEKAEELRTYSI